VQTEYICPSATTASVFLPSPSGAASRELSKSPEDSCVYSHKRFLFPTCFLFKRKNLFIDLNGGTSQYIYITSVVCGREAEIRNLRRASVSSESYRQSLRFVYEPRSRLLEPTNQRLAWRQLPNPSRGHTVQRQICHTREGGNLRPSRKQHYDLINRSRS
jgi:hypothetical protein